MTSRKDFQFFQSKGFMMIVALFLFILILTFFFGDRGILEIIRTQREISQLNQSITELEKQKEVLIREIEQLKRNPLAFEKYAREKLWLMKKNEKVIVLIEKKK